MEKLFEPFFGGKAHASRQGLGLGLSGFALADRAEARWRRANREFDDGRDPIYVHRAPSSRGNRPDPSGFSQPKLTRARTLAIDNASQKGPAQ